MRVKGKMITGKGKIISVALLLALFFPVAAAHAQTIIKIGRDIHIAENERVDSATAVGGQITVSGMVENNVMTFGGPVVLTGSAVVRGNVICIGGVVVRGNGSLVYGKITEVNAENIFPAVTSIFYDDTDEWSWLTDIISLFLLILLFTLALITAFLFPRPLSAVIDAIRDNKIAAFFWGLAGALLIAPFFMLLALSFVGIPLIPLAFSAILLAFMAGFIAVSALLGKFVLSNTFRRRQPSLVRETLLGLILWWVIGWAPFYAGMLIKAGVVTMGFGGVLLAVFGRGRKKRSSGNGTDARAVSSDAP